MLTTRALVRMLLAHDESELVERVPPVTDAELKRIGERAGHCAFSSEDAMRNGSMGTSRAVSLAAVDVLEGASRGWSAGTVNGILVLRNERFVV